MLDGATAEAPGRRRKESISQHRFDTDKPRLDGMRHVSHSLGHLRDFVVSSPSGRMWLTTVGIEVHLQLLCASKLFSDASARLSVVPNENLQLLDVACPGALPVLNAACIRQAIRAALALHGDVQLVSRFDRKHYFYHDLPTGYQITQQFSPIMMNGFVALRRLAIHRNASSATASLDGDRTTASSLAAGPRLVRLERMHLEQDAGQSFHEHDPKSTMVSLNRCGSALLEIVSRPEMHSGTEAVAYLKALQALMRHAGVSSGNMEDGSMRADVNVSTCEIVEGTAGELVTRDRPLDSVRCEIKNLNSFRSVHRSIEAEAVRQILCKESGGTLEQATLSFDAECGQTVVMRTKESTPDYRYIPDPDLMPVVVLPALVTEIRESMGLSLADHVARLASQHGMDEESAWLLVADLGDSGRMLGLFEETLKRGPFDAKAVLGWVLTDIVGRLRRHGIDFAESPITADVLAELLSMVRESVLSTRDAKQVLDLLVRGDRRPVREIVAREGLELESGEGFDLDAACVRVLQEHPDKVALIRKGKHGLLGFLVQTVLKQAGNKTTPQKVAQALQRLMSG